MRPEALNPLFAEVEALPGVGPQVAKALKRLDITRAVDLAFHLPTGTIERVHATAASAALLGRNVILELTPFESRQGGRGPLRIFASDGAGNTVTLVYFNNPGWAKKQSADRRDADRLGPARCLWRRVADRSSRGACRRQGRGPAVARAGLSADRRHRQPPHARAGFGRRWSARPSCPSGSSRRSWLGRAGETGVPRWPKRIQTRSQVIRATDWRMTRFSPTSWLCWCFVSTAAAARPLRSRATGG